MSKIYTHGHHASVLRSHSWRTAQNSAAYLIPHLTSNPSSNLLDVGCGPGTITADLAALLPTGSVVAIDTEDDVLSKAKETCDARGGLANVRFEKGDVHRLSYPDGHFDVVHAHQVLQHVADPVAALREMRRVTKPGGIVAVREVDFQGTVWYPDVDGMTDWLRLYSEVARSNGGEPDAGRRLHAWARQAGFDPAGIVKTASAWCYATPEEQAWWSDLWAERTVKSVFATTAVEKGHATVEELEKVAETSRTSATARPFLLAPHFIRTSPLTTAAAIMPGEITTPNDLSNGQMRSIPVGPSTSDKPAPTVLVSKIKDKVYATSSKCTHFGAPLDKGVLTLDGRVTCPWHGACFSVTTGDIEDAPGMACLKTFPARIVGDHIVVRVDDVEDARTARVPISDRGKPRDDDRDAATVVVVGAGSAGQAVAETLREEGFRGRVVVHGTEPYLPVDRTKLSKALGGVSADGIALRDADFYRERDIDLRVGSEVDRVDLDGRKVWFKDGTGQAYDYLALAPGSKPRTLSVPGSALRNVHVLRSVTDHVALDEAVTSASKDGRKPKVTVVGSGWIGLELASVLRKDDGADVTVVAKGKVPLEQVLGEKVGGFVKRWHLANGVTFMDDQSPKEFKEDAPGSGTVGSVLLENGTNVPADIVLVAIGASPATAFLTTSSLPINDDGSIDVTSHLSLPSRPEVFAAGDVARIPQVDGTVSRVEHWNVARNTGRLVARNIAALANSKSSKSDHHAPTATEFTKVPYFWSVQYGKSIRYAGTGASFDDVYVHGDVDSLKGEDTSFVAYYGKKGEVVAVASMNKDPYVSRFSELRRVGGCPTLEEIRNGTDILQVEVGESEGGKTDAKQSGVAANL
ncbi:hypothetical protein HKX48_009540 [Thoreauomyces humboldtii]|nr:hypothetical protein HKX48_009540 [Thoreauomyces humboldtii]